MKRSFLWGLLIGILLSSSSFWISQHFADSAPLNPTSSRLQKGGDENPDRWLLPKDFSLSSIYTSKEAMFVLEAPDTLSIHPEGSGDISAFHRSFTTEGVSPSPEDAKLILKTLQAANAYTLPSACGFQPDFLFRLKRAEHRLDLFLCLTCEEIIWRSEPGGQQAVIGVGLSNIGASSLRNILERNFSEQSGARKLRSRLKLP